MLEMLKEAPPAVEHTEPVMLYDLAFLVNTIYQQNVEPTQAGNIHKRLVNKLRPQLLGKPRMGYNWDDEYVDMLFALLIDMHVLVVSQPPVSDIKPRIVPGHALNLWSSLDLTGQAAFLLKKWLKSRAIFDVVGLEYDTWSTSWGPSFYSRDSLAGRRVLVEQILACTPGTWYSTDSLLNQLWKEHPVELYRLNATMQKEETKRAKKMRDRWMKTDGQVYLGMLDSTLRDLGLINLGYHPLDKSALQKISLDDDEDVHDDLYSGNGRKEPRNPDSFCLSEWGATVLMRALQQEREGSDPPLEKLRPLIVQPNFELFLLQPHMPTLYAVLPFAQLIQAGTASRLTLTKNTILRGLTMGQNIERIVETLSEYSQKTVPQNVTYSVQDWARLYKETRVLQAFLLETPSEAIATQICASSRFQKFGARMLAPCLVALDGDSNLQELRTTLEKEGVTPQLVGNFSSTRKT